MRATTSDYRVGDLMPLPTPYARTVWSEILDLKFVAEDKAPPVPLLDEKALIWAMDYLKFRKRNKLPTNVMDTGVVRIGKSSGSLVFKSIWDSPIYQDDGRMDDMLLTDNWCIDDLYREQKLDLDLVNFDIQLFNEALSKAIMGQSQAIIMDESGHELNALEWWNHTSLIKEFSIIGIKEIVAFFNLPHRESLTHRMRDEAMNLWNHFFALKKGRDLDRGYVEIREANPSKWNIDIYWKPAVTCRVPNFAHEDEWNAYENKKLEFVQRMSEMYAGESSVGGKRVKQAADQRDRLIAELLFPTTPHKTNKPYTQYELADILKVQQASVSKMWLSYKERTEKEAYMKQARSQYKELNRE